MCIVLRGERGLHTQMIRRHGVYGIEEPVYTLAPLLTQLTALLYAASRPFIPSRGAPQPIAGCF